MKADLDDDPNSEANPVEPKEIIRRLPLCRTAEEQRQLWYLQGVSLAAGGLERAARELIAKFPERLQTGTMVEQGAPPGGIYPEAVAVRIAREVAAADKFDVAMSYAAERFSREEQEPEDRDAEIAAVMRGREAPRIVPRKPAAMPAGERTVEHWRAECRAKAEESLAGLLRASISLHSDRVRFRGSKRNLNFIKEEWNLGGHPFPPKAMWFQDLPGALAEFIRGKGAAAAAAYYQTDVGRAVWQALDECRETGLFSAVDGEKGTGKTFTLKAWAAAHPGAAIIFTVPSDGNVSDFYRGLAGEMGFSNADTGDAGLIRRHLEDVLPQSGLMLALDEAYRLLSHRDRDGRPKLLEWVYSLADRGVPVMLCMTDKFARGLGIIEREGWDTGQFKRRIPLWTRLPRATAPEHLRKLAARLLPEVGACGAKDASAHALNFGDVSGLNDLVIAARRQAGQAGRAEPVFEDLERALGVRHNNVNAKALSLEVGVPRRRPAGRGVPAIAPQPARERTVERPRETDFESFNGRLNVPALDSGRQAAASLILPVPA